MNLCLSLGHNSSAVLVDDYGRIIIGYENERLSGIKSDSHFPQDAIKEIGKYYYLSLIDRVYVSHWATFGSVEEMSAKHWRPDILSELCPNAILQRDVDHHECHVSALRAFTSETFNWEIVADGFGNFNETMSIYHKGALIHRCFGYEKSLGLFYQYATAYMGLKMNQDEFKLLGYESKIKEVVSNKCIVEILSVAQKTADKFFRSIIDTSLEPKYDAVAGLEALPNLRVKIENNLDNLLYVKLKDVYSASRGSDSDRVVIAFYVQSVIESVLRKVVLHFGMDEVALTGGIFMNVKLNNIISKLVNKISVMPICGDQSGGLGAYEYYNGNLQWPDHLFWSDRGGLFTLDDGDPDMVVFDEEVDALRYISLCLNADRIVNLVQGKGEFGARALGNTSTLALPTSNNVEYINHLNQRSTIMPMAGMISPKALSNYTDADKVHKSLEYMIITLDAKKVDSSTEGCHHNHPINGSITNRVQLVDNGSLVGEIVKRFDCLINTSFNVHGVPIVLTSAQVQKSHDSQKSLDYFDRMVTVIVRN